MSGPTIVGGGIAGAAAACALAAAGHRPLLIEREAGAHDKVCGEFLSVETVAGLRALGVDPLALGAKPIREARLAHGRTLARSPLPFAALSLSRRRLDEALLARAAKLGVRVERGRAIARIEDVDRRDGVFIATGKHALRGVARPGGNGLTGLKMYYRLTRAQRDALEGAVELVLFPGGYAGLQLVEGDIANLCLLTRDAAGGMAGAIARAPHLLTRLEGAEALLGRSMAIANLPYGMVGEARARSPGRYLLGDQFAMIPSFTGDGMGMAISTAQWAAAAWAARGPSGADAYAAHARRRLRGQVRLAAGLAGAGLTPGLGGAATMAARAFPGALRAVARATRVREAA